MIFCSLKNKKPNAYAFYTGTDQIESDVPIRLLTKVKQDCPNIESIVVKNPRLEFAVMVNEYMWDGKKDFTLKLTIPNGTVIKKFASIGGDGFGFERDDFNQPFRMPHIGGVVIGRFCEVGDFTTVCRGTIDDTVIGDHTKIDDHVHISHNVQIGKRAMVVAGSVVCGSVEIEDDCWIGAGAVIREGLKIGKGATVGMGAIVTKNIPPGETWVGNPARCLR